MKNLFKILGIISLTVVFMTGCRTSPVYNVIEAPTQLETKVNDDEMYKAIKQAGISLGWRVSKVKPGLAKAQLNLRDHMALVEIPYNNKEFSINYKNSINLKYNKAKGIIHSNYNGWIQNLENAIVVQLSALN